MRVRWGLSPKPDNYEGPLLRDGAKIYLTKNNLPAAEKHLEAPYVAESRRESNIAESSHTGARHRNQDQRDRSRMTKAGLREIRGVHIGRLQIAFRDKQDIPDQQEQYPSIINLITSG